MDTSSDNKSMFSTTSNAELERGGVGVGGGGGGASQRVLPLHERCTTKDMLAMQEVFDAAHDAKLTRTEFRELLRTRLNMEYCDEDFNILFMKINTNRDEMLSWEEFVSHLLLGYFENDSENQRETLTLPIIGLPRMLKSHHRHVISRICFCPDVAKDRSTRHAQGNYVTASRDGMINWWSQDMTVLRHAFSSSPLLKVRTTWVTDMVCMPDVNIIVTSSTERDLRFYDCTANTFTLKMIIYSWDYMISTMFYYFHQDISEDNILICGDVGGNIRILLFTPVLRGPFQNKPGVSVIKFRHKDFTLAKNNYCGLRLVELKSVHSEWVRQVSFYASLHCVVSCATCPDSLLMCDIAGSKTHNMFRITKGIHCFTFDEEAHVLVTGGPDCTVRVWNPFVPASPSIVFQGHHAGIVSVILQDNASKIYSISRDHIIKCWDVHSQACLQTYIDIPSSVAESSPFSVVYNQGTRELLIAGHKIATIVLDEQLNPEHTDGFTHSKGVAKVLYNPLFKVIVTCGMDSIIMCWDPLTGKRNAMVREAHTRLLHGELVPVEITAACFDPGNQLLLTGARNGTLKVWNFNTGICLRNMMIEANCEVTAVFWVEGRIMAVGWNRHVTEFEDTGTGVQGKAWELRHSEDVMAADAREPFSIATGSYNSELILWKMETGQPYRRFSCMDPMTRIKMHYSKKDTTKSPNAALEGEKIGASRASVCRRQSIMVNPLEAMKKARARRVSTVSMPTGSQNLRKLAVHAMCFLKTRPQVSDVASLMVSVENGYIQCWSDHSSGGFKGSFQGIHTAGDYVSSFTTDPLNEFLFTGTTMGYIKIWLMTNFMTNKKEHINMPLLRLQFPFMWRDRIEGRAKRCVRDQKLPLLLSSYRAHLRCVTALAYIPEQKFVLSGSSDYSVRMWRLTGEYLQTLGSFLPWTLETTRFPPDVKKVASFTTLKVWRGGEVSRYVPGLPAEDKLRFITEEELRTRPYGERLQEPLLGNYFELPARPAVQDPVLLDDSLKTIPLYTHLRMASVQPIKRPPTPDLVKETRLKKERTRKLHFQPSDQKPSPGGSF